MAVAEAAGGTLSEAAAARILRQIDGVAKGRAAEKYGGDVAAALNQMVVDQLAQQKLNSLIAKRSKLQTEAAKKQILEFVKNKDSKQLFGERLLAMMGGSQKKGFGNRYSIDAEVSSKIKSAIGRLEGELKDSGVWKDFLSNRTWENTARELAEYGKAEPKYGLTGDKSAQKQAEIIHRFQAETIAFQNMFGSLIRAREGYAVPQTHSREGLIALGKEPGKPFSEETAYRKWKELILPLLDHTETFNGADPDYVLKKIFNNFITGDFSSGPESDGMNLVGGSAFKASAKRYLHFKDIDSWIAYQKVMGQKMLHAQVIQSLHDGMRRGVLMKRLGPDFEGTFKDIRQTLMQEVKDNDEITNKDAQSKALTDWKLDAVFNQLTGRSEIHTNPTAANVQHMTTALTQLASLGYAGLRATTTDPSFMLFTAGQAGLSKVNLLGRHLQFLVHMSPDARKAVRLYGTMADGVAGTGASRYYQFNKPGQTLGRMTDKFFQLNLLNWWTDNSKGGFTAALLDDFGQHAGDAFTRLPEEKSRLLGEYGITPQEWDALRASASKVDGKTWITKGNLDSLPKSQQEALMTAYGEKSWERAKDRLESKWSALVYDQASHAIPTPGVNQRAWTTLGTEGASTRGVLLRMASMFTSFPLAINEKFIQRGLFSENNLTFKQWMAHDWKGKATFAAYIAMSLAGGYMSQVLVDLSQGKQPRPFTNEDGSVQWGTYIDALRAGGALGMYGDFLLQDYSAHAFSSGRAGPLAGKLDPFMTGLSQVMRGEAPAGGQILKATINSLPYNNLFWSRHALDYLILWHLQALVDPDSLRRVERSLQTQKNQQYYPGHGPTDYYRP